MDLKPSDAPATALMPVLGRIPTRCKTRYRRDMEPRDTPIGEFGDRRITIPGSMRYGGSIALASTPGFQFYDIMRLRSWLITTLLVGATQVVLSILLILQHDALYAELLRQRVAVIAQTTAGTFKPILSLGLPISTLRGGDQILARGVDIDPDILAIHAVNPSGIIAHSTGPKPATIADDVLAAMRLSDETLWGLETREAIYAGVSLRRTEGEPMSGAIILKYPNTPLDRASGAIIGTVTRSAAIVFAASAILAFGLIYLLLARPRNRRWRYCATGRFPAICRSCRPRTSPIWSTWTRPAR